MLSKNHNPTDALRPQRFCIFGFAALVARREGLPWRPVGRFLIVEALAVSSDQVFADVGKQGLRIIERRDHLAQLIASIALHFKRDSCSSHHIFLY